MKYFLLMIAVLPLPGSVCAATPSGEEQAKVENALKAQGYSKWKRIELDNGKYEVDDAIASDGKQYDLRLDAKTMQVIDKDAD